MLGKLLQYEGAPLRLQRKTEYIAAKAEERKNKPPAPATPAVAARQPAGEEATNAEGGEAKGAAPAAAIEIPEGAHLRVCFEADADLSDVTWRGISELLGGRDAGVKHVSFKTVRWRQRGDGW